MKTHYPIKQWLDSERPREKLRLHGPRFLSHAELLAILIQNGNTQKSALDLAKEILIAANNHLWSLNQFNESDFTRIPGIGPAKSAVLQAAIELGRRTAFEPPADFLSITCSTDAFNFIRHEIEQLSHEECWVILMNRAGKAILKKRMSIGGLSATVVDPRNIFSIALENKASGLILVHNHPSGNLKPSSADDQITRKVQQSGEMLDIPLRDHLIIGHGNYFSYADEGKL